MYWQVSFKKKSPAVGEGEDDIPGFRIQSVRIATTSSKKKVELIEKYKKEGFDLVRCEEINAEIGGLEGIPTKDTYWMPDIQMYQHYLKYKDISEEILRESAKEIKLEEVSKKVVSSAPLVKNSNKVCNHKFNCSAHKKICVEIHGLEPIYTKPVL